MNEEGARMASPGQSSKEGKSKGGHTRGLRASEEHFGPGTGAESVPDLLLPKIRAGEGTFWAAAGATMGKPRLQNWTRGGKRQRPGSGPTHGSNTWDQGRCSHTSQDTHVPGKPFGPGFGKPQSLTYESICQHYKHHPGFQWTSLQKS